MGKSSTTQNRASPPPPPLPPAPELHSSPFFPPPIPWHPYSPSPFSHYPYYPYYPFPNYGYYCPPPWPSSRLPPPFFPFSPPVAPPSGHSGSTGNSVTAIRPAPYPQPSSQAFPATVTPATSASIAVPPLTEQPHTLQSSLPIAGPSVPPPSYSNENFQMSVKQEIPEKVEYFIAPPQTTPRSPLENSSPVTSTVLQPQPLCISNGDPSLIGSKLPSVSPPPFPETLLHSRPPFLQPPPPPPFYPPMPNTFVPPHFWTRPPYIPYPCSHCCAWGYSYYPAPSFPPFPHLPFPPPKWCLDAPQKANGEDDEGHGIQSDNYHGSADVDPKQESYHREVEGDEHEDIEEEPQFVLTDEWAEFFVQPHASQKEKRRHHKKEYKT